MELSTWTSVISWCEERVGPLKNCTNPKPTDRPLAGAGPCPDPVSPAQLFAVCPSRASLSGSPETDTRVWRGAGEGLWIYMPNPPGGEPLWWASLSACPAAFTVVWLTVGLLVGDTDLKRGAAVGGIPCSRWMYSSHWTAAIYNLISKNKKTYTDIFLFFFLTFVTFPHSSKNGSKDSHVMLKFMDGWSSNT